MMTSIHGILKQKLATALGQELSQTTRRNIMSGLSDTQDNQTATPTNPAATLASNIRDNTSVLKDVLRTPIVQKNQNTSKVTTGLFGNPFRGDRRLDIPEQQVQGSGVIPSIRNKLAPAIEAATDKQQDLYDAFNPQEQTASKFLPSINIPIQSTIRNYLTHRFPNNVISGILTQQGQKRDMLREITDLRNEVGMDLDFSKLNSEYPLFPRNVSISRTTPGSVLPVDQFRDMPINPVGPRSAPGTFVTANWPF